MRDGIAIPSTVSFTIASLNTRRLWQRDQSIHDGFRVLTDLIDAAQVGVLCVQEVFAGDHPLLPPDQPYVYDGPIASGGREAGFLTRCGVTGAPINGIEDTTNVRWRVFNNSWCVCSFYAPHAGMPQELRVEFWRDFVAIARRVFCTVELPMVIAGDANIWHPHFNLGRSRSCDSIVIPFVDLLMASCQLRLCNPPDRATHISGAGLDCIFISSSHAVEVTVHDGDDCCAVAPICCPLLGSDHFLCVTHGLTILARPESDSLPTLPPLRDWKPTLMRAHSELMRWSVRIQNVGRQHHQDRGAVIDALFNDMISILHRHAPFQRRGRRQRQPSWWTPQCFEAHVARNGGRTPTPELHDRFRISTVLFGEPKVSFGPSGKTRLQTCPE